MPREWEPIVEDFTRVQKLVHLAMRRDPVDIAEMVPHLFVMKREAYKDRLTIEAANVGCAGRTGTVPHDRLSDMKKDAETEAAGIANTYNYDLAMAIRTIRAEVPTANRNTYAMRLHKWEVLREEWKSKQIALWNYGRWGDIATDDFLRMNPQLPAESYAIIVPQNRAVCSICIEWVGKGKMPIEESYGQEWPAHLNCPHRKRIIYANRAEDCSELWVGAPLSAWYDELEMQKELEVLDSVLG